MQNYKAAIENWASLSGAGETTTITGTLLNMLASLGKLAGNVKGLLELL
ncbi:hypothetical protein [Corynebacterium riegelii]|nr:hypothetical protein [Corynebacterium riegelii]